MAHVIPRQLLGSLIQYSHPRVYRGPITDTVVDSYGTTDNECLAERSARIGCVPIGLWFPQTPSPEGQ